MHIFPKSQQKFMRYSQLSIFRSQMIQVPTTFKTQKNSEIILKTKNEINMKKRMNMCWTDKSI